CCQHVDHRYQRRTLYRSRRARHAACPRRTRRAELHYLSAGSGSANIRYRHQRLAEPGVHRLHPGWYGGRARRVLDRSAGTRRGMDRAALRALRLAGPVGTARRITADTGRHHASVDTGTLRVAAADPGGTRAGDVAGAEIAATLGTTVGAVKAAQFRAYTTLRDRFQHEAGRSS